MGDDGGHRAAEELSCNTTGHHRTQRVPKDGDSTFTTIPNMWSCQGFDLENHFNRKKQKTVWTKSSSL